MSSSDLFKSRQFWLLLIDFIGIVGGFVLQNYFPQYQQVVVLVVGAAQPLVMFLLSKFTQDDTLKKVSSAIGKTLIGLFLIAFVFTPAATFADADLQPWMSGAASMGCGGSTPAEVQHAFTNFQNNRAANTASYNWQGDYAQAVTDFLHKHGCVSYGLNDLTMTLPLYVATQQSFIDYVDILPVQFRALVK